MCYTGRVIFQFSKDVKYFPCLYAVNKLSSKCTHEVLILTNKVNFDNLVYNISP